MGQNLSIGQFDYSNMPWLKPTMPNFDFSAQWSNMPIFNFSAPNWNNTSSSTSSASSSKPETYEQYKARLEKERAAIAELTKTKKEETKVVDEINAQVKNIEDGKQKDGSSKIEDKTKLKDVSFWKKAGKVGTGILTGTLNVVKSLVGYDKDGKWNWKKCLKNVAIAVGVAALCVVAAPLGAGLAATLGGGAIASAVGTAVAATPTILGYAGLAAGTVGAGKGIYKACKAETMQELDEASQEIGSGATIAIASKVGLKKMSAAGGYTKADGGFLGLKNIFVNPWKASEANFATAKHVMNATGGGVKGFAKSCKYSIRSAKNKPVEEAKQNFEAKNADVLSNLEKKINEVQTKVNNSTGAEKQLAEAELDAMLNNYTKLADAKNATDWKSILNENKKASFRERWNMSAEEKSAYNAVRNANKDYNKTVAELKALKFKLMKKMLNNKRYEREVQSFGMTKDNWFSGLKNYYDCARSGIQMPTSKWGWFGKAFNVSCCMLDPAWIVIGPAQRLTGTSFGLSNAIAQGIKPMHEFTGEHLSAEQVKSSLAELKTQKEQIQKEIDKADTKLRELSA